MEVVALWFVTEIKYELSRLESFHGLLQHPGVVLKADQGVLGGSQLARERGLLQGPVHGLDLLRALVLLDPPAHPEPPVGDVLEDQSGGGGGHGLQAHAA